VRTAGVAGTERFVSGDNPRRPMVRTVVVITVIAAFVAIGAILLWLSLR
jgi:hypothetical protein